VSVEHLVQSALRPSDEEHLLLVPVLSVRLAEALASGQGKAGVGLGSREIPAREGTASAKEGT